MKACPGMCVVERITNYCDAILNTDDLCKPGLKCCVYRDEFGDKPPPYLIIPKKTKNATQAEVTTPKPLATTTESYKTPFTPRPTVSVAKQKPCTGECISGWFALLCEEYDSEAYCAEEAKCCITSSVSTSLYYKRFLILIAFV